MNLASALINSVLTNKDSITWAAIRRNYLPPELHSLYKKINAFQETYKKLPNFEELKFYVRDHSTLQKIHVIEQIQVNVDPSLLLSFLKNEKAQAIAYDSLQKLIDNSIGFETAEETVETLHNIIVTLETEIDITSQEEDVSTMSLFDDEETLKRKFELGLNSHFDHYEKFYPGDLILVGGKRGSGKSLVCSNIMANEYSNNYSCPYFTVEMRARQILQRTTAIATGIPYRNIKNKLLDPQEMRTLAEWWAGRYKGGDEVFKTEYSSNTTFEEFHSKLVKLPTKENQLDIVYDPSLTIPKITLELERIKLNMDPRVVVIDYINVLKMRAGSDMYDWKDQALLAKSLKEMAQKFEVAVVCPYQIDATGEARFSKGILDAADAAFVLDSHEKSDNAMTFKTTKMRDSSDNQSFTSVVNWDTLKIGPETAIIAESKEEEEAEDVEPGEMPF